MHQGTALVRHLGDLGYGLDRSGLVVPGHDGDKDHIRPHELLKGLHVHTPVPVDRHLVHMDAFCAQVFHALHYARVLNGGGHDPSATAFLDD